MNVKYSRETIEKQDLQKFRQIAWEVLCETQYGREFSKHVKCIALCQGAAIHYAVMHGLASRYLDPQKAGLKDIDIWFFFDKPGFHPRWRRTHDLGPSKFGKNPEDTGYIGRRMDFFGRSIPFQSGDDLKSALLRWLQNGKPKSAPWYLAQKAIIGLYPENIMGDELWINPELKVDEKCVHTAHNSG